MENKEIQLHEQEQEQEDKEKWLVHEVKAYDTLFGLSIEYQVSAHDIKSANGISTDDIYQFKQIKIPLQKMPNQLFELDNPSEEQVKNQLKISQFATFMEGKDYGDLRISKYYLESNDYDIKETEKQYSDDIAFEKQQKNKKVQYQELSKYEKLE